MKNIIHLLIIVLIGFNPMCTFAQPDTKVAPKTLSHLKKFNADYSKGITGNRTELIQSYYSDGIRLMPAFQKTIIGKGNVDLYHKAFSARFIVAEFTMNQVEVLDLGSQILEIGRLNMKLTLKSNGQEHTLAGKYLNLWEEQSTGELLLITAAWNYDQHYGEFHERLKFDEVPSFHTALQPNVPVNSSISFELSALNRLLDETVTQHDASTWSQYYSDDAMQLSSYHPIFRGKQAIVDYLNMHAKELPIFEGLDIRNDRIDNLGAFVIEYASHIASWKNGQATGVNMGKNIRIWRREPDHSLKLFRTIGMYD